MGYTTFKESSREVGIDGNGKGGTIILVLQFNLPRYTCCIKDKTTPQFNFKMVRFKDIQSCIGLLHTVCPKNGGRSGFGCIMQKA